MRLESCGAFTLLCRNRLLALDLVEKLRNLSVMYACVFLWFRVTKNYVLTIDVGTRLI